MSEKLTFSLPDGFNPYFTVVLFVFQFYPVCKFGEFINFGLGTVRSERVNPQRPNSDLSKTSHCNIKGLSVSAVIRIENMITQVQFYLYFNSFSPLLL